MVALRLNGHQISNIDRLRAHFNPIEMVARREAFASFARNHMRLGLVSCYHAVMFAAAARAHVEDHIPDWDKNYLKNPFHLSVKEGLADMREDDLLQYLEENVPESDLEKWHALLELVRNTGLGDGEKRLLFYMLCAGFALADANPLDYRINAHELADAYRGKLQSKRSEEPFSRDVPLPDEADPDAFPTLTLEARKQDYGFALYSSAKLSPGERIRTIRITAGGSRGGSRYLNVRIRLYRAEDGSSVQERTLKPGEFIYLNAVGNRVVKIMETRSENNGAILERKDLSRDELIFTSPDEVKKPNASMCRDVSCLAVERHGFILVQNYRLKTGYYSARQAYTRLAVLEDRKIVEAAVWDDYYVILQDTGRVYSSRPDLDSLRSIPALHLIPHEFLRTKEASS